LWWFRQLTAADIIADFMAGLTVAVIVLPQEVAFATIAGKAGHKIRFNIGSSQLAKPQQKREQVAQHRFSLVVRRSAAGLLGFVARELL